MAKRTRILHVVSSLNVGGAERFVLDLSQQLLSYQNIEVELLSMGNAQEPLVAEATKLGLAVHYHTQVSAIKKLIKRFDVVHVHSSHCLPRVLVAMLFSFGVKLVYTRHNERVHTDLKWRISYFLCRFMLDKMVFVAAKAEQNYLKAYPEFVGKTRVILNGVLPINVAKTTTSKLRLGHIGRFVPLKAQHVLIQAVALLPPSIQQQISLNFFGTGELMAKNQQLAHQLIPDVEVIFSGFENNRELIYQQLDVLVVTSETEGLSLAIIEALASKTPCIVSDVGGNPELIEHQVNGLLYPFADSQALANAIETLVTQPKLRQQFAEKGKNKYLAKFSMAQCAEQYLSCY